MTPYQKHKARWVNCQRCPLAAGRDHVVLARGSVPADIAFIGEAPGASEDVLGRPFVGPAGHLMDKIIAAAWEDLDDILCDPTYALTNLVACIPRGEDGAKVTEPPEDAIRTCAPRLQEFLVMCRPRLVVCVGRLPAKWLRLPDGICIPIVVEIIHPAAILRIDVSQRGLAVQRCVVTVSDAIKETWG